MALLDRRQEERLGRVTAKCATRAAAGKLSKMQSVSHRLEVLTVVERLRNQHGEVGA
jgi:hypothetical protein